MTPSNSQAFHTLTVADVCSQFSTSSTTGLPSSTIPPLLQQHGPNIITNQKHIEWYHVLVRQLQDVMNWVFLALGAIAFALGDYITGPLLILLSILNVYLSFSQEYAAEQTLAALRNLSSLTSLVIRDGAELVMDSKDIVPGDLVVIKAGDRVPADIRLVHASGLEVDEALLTGESVPVRKKVSVIPNPDEPLGDRLNMAYSSTVVVKGRGSGIVVSTGMSTEMGKIAKTLTDAETANSDDRTQIQRSLLRMYIALLITAIILFFIVVAINKFKVPYDVGLYAVTAAMSVLPAGLTTVLTVTLVLGGKEMTKQNAVVRRLKCLETLGSVTHIFSDKTGTLTMARMSVVRLWLKGIGIYSADDGRMSLGDGNDPVDANKPLSDSLKQLLYCCVLCNTTSVTDTPALLKESKDTNPQSPQSPQSQTGAPTEVALATLAASFSITKQNLHSNEWTLMTEHHFDSTIKRMSVVYRPPNSDSFIVYTKGAAESVLPISEAGGEAINGIIEDFGGRGLRAMVLAWKKVDIGQGNWWEERSAVESGLTMLGVCGIYDPPRHETKPSVELAHRAGISVHMLTGDHLTTALAIASQISLLPSPPPRNSYTTGPAFDALTDAEIDALPSLPLVIARCTPMTKVRVIQAAKRRGYIGLMTGDGVNDSPSLRSADVGVAMGGGSDVAKGVCDMVLVDDNFATIITAIREGRRIFRNIQRFLLYYWVGLACSGLIIVINLFVRDPDSHPVSPISTVQMIFLYIFLSPPAASLSTQEASPTIMREPPRPVKEGLFNREIILDLIMYTLGMTALIMTPFYAILYTATPAGVTAVGCDKDYSSGCAALFRARSTLLGIFTLAITIQAVHCRSFRRSEFLTSRGLLETWRNRTWMWSLVICIASLLVFIMIPRVAREGFAMDPLSWEWAIIAGSAVVWVLFGEVWKALKRRWFGREDGSEAKVVQDGDVEMIAV